MKQKSVCRIEIAPARVLFFADLLDPLGDGHG
jgi:hypothetical protein